MRTMSSYNKKVSYFHVKKKTVILSNSGTELDPRPKYRGYFCAHLLKFVSYMNAEDKI